MLAQKFTFVDFDGVKRTETHHFNLTEAEIFDLEMETEAGLQAELERAVEGVDNRKILEFVKKLIQASYGEKADDGRHFWKSEEITQRFIRSAFYSDFLFSLFEDNGKRGTAFINGILPADKVRAAAKKAAGEKVRPEDLSPKERWDQRQREKNIPEPEVIDFSNFSEESYQDAYSGTADRAPQDSPPIQVLRPEDAQIVTHEESHLAESEESITRREARELAELRAWKAQQEQDTEDTSSVIRPPHESGPGHFQA